MKIIVIVSTIPLEFVQSYFKTSTFIAITTPSDSKVPNLMMYLESDHNDLQNINRYMEDHLQL